MTTPSHSRQMPKRRPATEHRPGRRIVAWLAFGLPTLFLIALVSVNAVQEPRDGVVGSRVPPFLLLDTHGAAVERDDVVGDGYSLFYFSMGVGCDGCFVQIPELEPGLAERGIRLVSIMVDPLEAVSWEAARFRVASPILIDADRSLSEAMGMLGIYGHYDRPSHSFALVDPEGTVQWVRHYAEMFVPAASFFTELDAA